MTLASLYFSSLLSIGVLYEVMARTTPEFTAAWALGTAAGTAGLAALSRRTRPASLEEKIPQEELEAVIPCITLSPAEEAYCSTMMLISNIVPEDSLAERELRTTLKQINSLLEMARQLEKNRITILDLLQEENMGSLAGEYAKLSAQLNTATDPHARNSLEDSMNLWLGRMENSRALSQNLQRIEAQHTVMLQTLASVRSALARLQTTPHIETHLGVSDSNITDTISQINQQAKASEQAVQEVLNITLGG